MPILTLAKEKTKPDMYIYLKSCSTNLTPLFLGEEGVTLEQTGSRILQCNKFKEVYSCIIRSKQGTGQKMFVAKHDNKDFIKFGDLKNEENFIIKDRSVVYVQSLIKSSKTANIVYTEICQGVYSTKDDLDNSKLYNLNFGLISIFKKMTEGFLDE